MLRDAVTLPIAQELRQKSTDIGTQLPEEGRFCIENMSLMSLGLASSIRRRCMWAHCIVCGASRQGRSDIWVGSNPHSFGTAHANAGQSIPWDR